MKLNPFLLQHFVATSKQISEERESADAVVPQLLSTTPLSECHTLAPRLATQGALETIAKLFRTEIASDTEKARALAELGVAIADGFLSETEYPAIMVLIARAHAWKDLGYYYRIVARFAESIDALIRAENYVKDAPSAAYDVATIHLHLAAVLQEVDRFDESLTFARHAQNVFLGHGDTAKAVNCAIAEAVLQYRLKRFAESLATSLRLLYDPGPYPAASHAALHQAAGFAALELGRYLEAEFHFDEAIAYHRSVKQPLNVLRAEIGLGRLLVRRGDPVKSLPLLARIRNDFAVQNLIEESGLCGLELVDAYLRLDRPHDAQTLARTVIEEFTAAGLNGRAITALGYLTEAIASKRATTEVIAGIRDYIISLRTNPERELRRTA